VVAGALFLIGVDVTKKPSGLCRTNGRRKRPDGMTWIPWKAGKPVVWDVTAICNTAFSSIDFSISEAGTVAEIAATRKTAKYSNLSSQYTFCPSIAVETLSPLNEDARLLLSDLGGVW